ncbi:hypothetical protein SOV_19900 [Sporomusa ovata DSM 2662]|nr:hypothetical protein SOV_1c13220 [Sporomusa ovata DSM 2662]
MLTKIKKRYRTLEDTALTAEDTESTEGDVYRDIPSAYSASLRFKKLILSYLTKK